MSRPDVTQRMVERSRAIASGDDEPKHTDERDIISPNGYLYVNLSRYASITHDFEKGDTVKVHTTEEGVFVEPAGREGDNL